MSEGEITTGQVFGTFSIIINVCKLSRDRVSLMSLLIWMSVSASMSQTGKLSGPLPQSHNLPIPIKKFGFKVRKVLYKQTNKDLLCGFMACCLSKSDLHLWLTQLFPCD